MSDVTSFSLFKRAGDCSLLSLTPQHIDIYKSKRLKDKVSPVTVNVEIRALRTIMNIAVRWQYLEVNPFSKMQQLSNPEPKPVRDMFIGRQLWRHD
jgi:hypothetical protein